jgi:hypothetical protein
MPTFGTSTIALFAEAKELYIASAYLTDWDPATGEEL